LALGLRLWGITWQLPWRLHPDEVNYVEDGLTAASELDFKSQYTNQPPLFRHLLTVEYLVFARLGILGGPLVSAETILQGDRPESDPTLMRAYVIGRVTAAVLGAANVLVLLLTVRNLLGTPVGILSALLLSTSFAHVRESHFALSTVPATFLASLTIYCAAQFFLRGGWRWFLACCVCAIAASATRDAVAVVTIVPVVALVVRQRRMNRDRLFRAAVVGLAFLSLAFAALFVALAPQSFFGQSPVTAEIVRVQRELLDGLSNWPWIRKAFGSLLDHMTKASLGPIEGQSNTPVALLYLEALAQGFGLVPMLLAVGGLLLLIRRRPLETALLGSFCAAYLLLVLAQERFWVRFAIPLLPFLAICAGYGLYALPRFLPGAWRKKAAVALLVVALIQPAASLLLSSWLLVQTDTRVVARNWIESSLSPSSHVRATEYALPGVVRAEVNRWRADLNGRVPISHISLEGIEDELTGQGCGDVLAVSSFDLSLNDDTPDAILGYLHQRGKLLAQFNPGRNGDLPWDPDEVYGPFWNLHDRTRPGPTVQLFAMGPSCDERGPKFVSPQLLALAEVDKGAMLGEGKPRTQDSVAYQFAQPPLLPEAPVAAAVGRFFPNDSNPYLLTVLFDDRPEMEAYRLVSGAPPERVQFDPNPVDTRLEIVRHGMAAVDVDGDGVDELAVIKRGRGDKAQLDLYQIGAEESPLLASGAMDAMDGSEVTAMASVPPDSTYPPGTVALLYRHGDTFTIHLARVRLSGQTGSSSKSSPTVRLEPIGPLFFRPPPGSPAYRISFAAGDFDGDGRNEFALLDRQRDAAQIFKVPTGQPNSRATMSHYDRWALPPGTTHMLVVPSPPTASR
jgi:hypothetical protein